MYPFRGAIGRFRIHSARILPGRPLFLRRGPWNHAWGEDLADARRCAGLSAPAGRIRARAVREKGMRMWMSIPSISFPRYEKAEEGGTLAVYGKRPMRSREVSSPFAEELALKSLALSLGW